MSRAGRRVASSLALVTAAHVTPSVLTVPFLRSRVLGTVSSDTAVALTFDDGPDPDSTPRYADALAELEVRATFFVLGTKLRAHPDLARSLVAGGHEIAVHGWTHRPHLLRTPWDVAADIRRTCELVRDTAGHRPRYWRPPHGIVTGTGLATAAALGLRPMLWTADGRDWRSASTPQSITERILGSLRPGGVVLLHDTHAYSAPGRRDPALDAVPMLVSGCRSRGWAPGRLSDMPPG